MGTEGGCARIHTVSISGQLIATTVTMDSEAVKHWIECVKEDRNVVGQNVAFEVEYHNKETDFICTMQLYVANRCLLYQIHFTDNCPASLDEFLCNHDYTFIGTDVITKLKLLGKQFGLTPGMKHVDLVENVVGLAGEKQGLMDSNALGLDVDSAWGRQDSILSIDQIHYATMDAFFNLDIARKHKLGPTLVRLG